MPTTITASASIPEDWWTGRTLTKYDAQYTWIALGFDDGALAVMSVDEVSVGKWFEVFPLAAETSVPDFLSFHIFEWVELPMPLLISSVRSLWRQEWLEPVADNGQFMGSGPHFVQNVAPLGSASPGANAFVVKAGIELQGSDGRLFVICSSRNTPFKVDFVSADGQIEDIRQFHTVQ